MMAAMNSCRKNTTFYNLFGCRKRAFKSKPAQGIISTLKKPKLEQCSNISSGLSTIPNSCRKKGFRYGPRKRAIKSKPPQGITLKKPKLECSNVSTEEDDSHMRVIVSGYQSLDLIGFGAYGIVHKARSLKTGEIVAIKEECNRSSSSSISSFREIDALENLLPHPSIVAFKEAVADDSDDSVYIVMEYLEDDLERYIKSSKRVNLSEVKCLMKQLLEGVKFLHENNLMHRDLKPANILIDKETGVLKICDFGLSRPFGSKSVLLYTPGVGTPWYKSPEVLLGAKNYSCSVDMWSVGCIMAELLTRQVLFRGESELEQIKCVYRILGTPNDDVWPGFSTLPGSRANFVQQPCDYFVRDKFPMLTGVGFDLLSKLLSCDPCKRITAEDALHHAWFQED